MNRYSWLERQLDRDDLTDQEFELFNAEINSLQDAINASKEKQKQELIEKSNKISQMIAEGKVNELVEEYGQQFIGDYTITDSHQVLSFAFNDRNPDQQKVWQLDSHEAAVKKLNNLLYNRVYDHYVRHNPETITKRG